MGAICSLLGDANSQVRSGAMEAIVEIYRHVGVKVRIDLSKRGLPSARMSQITARFNAVDATTGNHTHFSDNEVTLMCLCNEEYGGHGELFRMIERASAHVVAMPVPAPMVPPALQAHVTHHAPPV